LSDDYDRNPLFLFELAKTMQLIVDIQSYSPLRKFIYATTVVFIKHCMFLWYWYLAQILICSS